MYLKSLTLRGFKSFASSTTLQLEPGITCIVGPNGSGKSNVVDALAWVMGEQGAKSLRGGKMEDVIFAGTSGRPPLGRAEVALTIDNTDGALPIDYAEVTISRTMFRNGGSEYAINGASCRLLDVQELLSDSGIGREMHVIVGQGQLDSILHATPEDRRGFIEEAAGVLKHRKRKEKALRKLDSTEGNLTRLGDLLSEIRRQLKPLGRQAEVARKAAFVQADVRDARARLLADDLVTARETLERDLADETALQRRRDELEAATAAEHETEAALEVALRDDLPALARAQETWFALTGVQQQLRGTTALAAERVRNAEALAAEPAGARGQDPDELEAEAVRVRGLQTEIDTEIARLRTDLAERVAAREAAERAHAEEEQRVATGIRAAADRREGLARLHGQVNSLHSRVAATEEEMGRLEASRSESLARWDRAQRDFTALETRVAGLDAGEEGLDAEHEAAATALADLEERLAKTGEEARTIDRQVTALAARKEALELGLAHQDGASSLLAADSPVSGLLGTVAALVRVRTGYERAVAAALGSAADALGVEDLGSAVRALTHLKDQEQGRAGLLLGGSSYDGHLGDGTAEPPSGATWAHEVVSAPRELEAALRHALADVVVVGDLPAAETLVRAHAGLTAVTRDGDVVSSHFVRGGSRSQPSLLEVQAAVDQAAASLQEAGHDAQRLTFDRARLEEEREQTQRRVDVALAKLHESDATLAAVAEELGQLGSAARAAKAEAQRAAEAIGEAETARGVALSALAELQQRLADAESSDDGAETDTSERERLATQAREARSQETDVRLALRTAEERARSWAGRADALTRTATEERAARARSASRRDRVAAEGEVGRAVTAAVSLLLTRLESSLREAAVSRTQVEERRREREAELVATRATLRRLGGELEEIVSTVHRDDVVRAQQRIRLEQLEERALDELGLDAESLVAEFGPDRPVVVAGAEEETAEPVPFVREEQVARLRVAERALATLGRVNPLALEEFSALEERHQFLGEQLEDLRRTRRDLLDIVAEVDDRVEQVFAQAWEDVREAFEGVFSRLFPGGEGRLVLTDPSDLLTTGVEVEARPAGKKVKRLSLLSGGERSLVAVAFLVALFKARPSPFYILDEVEAALDDTNLGRLLQIYEELRENSQLLVITHQKRTMEVGDALYGVSMRGDGVSTVISQRLRETATA